MTDKQEQLSFSEALDLLKQKFSVQRAGWNGVGQKIYLHSGDDSCGAHIRIVPVEGPHMPWFASQADLLADDWRVLK